MHSCCMFASVMKKGKPNLIGQACGLIICFSLLIFWWGEGGREEMTHDLLTKMNVHMKNNT